MTFAYPKTKHTRVQAPAIYTDYRKYKPCLREEFSGRCVYCRAHEGLRCGHDEYGVDHYRPKSLAQFKHLACAYTNLFYCCPACNRRKGPYWPKPGKETTEFIPNPCDHVMFEHMAFREGEVFAKTEAGRKACEILNLNHERAVAWRRGVLKSISALEFQASTLSRQLVSANAKIAAGEVLPDGAIQSINNLVNDVRAAITFLRGE